jgi:hypothetical protein
LTREGSDADKKKDWEEEEAAKLDEAKKDLTVRLEAKG